MPKQLAGFHFLSAHIPILCLFFQKSLSLVSLLGLTYSSTFSILVMVSSLVLETSVFIRSLLVFILYSLSTFDLMDADPSNVHSLQLLVCYLLSALTSLQQLDTN